MKKAYDIFISHDSRDKEVAQHLKKFLELIFLQAEVYVSGQNIKGGDSWFDNIVTALRNSKVIIGVISQNSINNNWVYFETGAGVVNSKSIPVLDSNLEFSDLTKYPVSSIQARKLNEDGIEKLINDISDLLEVRRPESISTEKMKALIENCRNAFLVSKALELEVSLEELRFVEDEVENSQELQEVIEKKVERTRVFLKNHWIEIVHRRSKQKAILNSIHKYSIDQLFDFLLSIGITSEAENCTDFLEAEKISMYPSKMKEQQHGIDLLDSIMERIRPIELF